LKHLLAEVFFYYQILIPVIKFPLIPQGSLPLTPHHPMISQIIEKTYNVRGETPSPLRGEGGGEGGATNRVIAPVDMKNILKQKVLSSASPSPQPSPLKGEGVAASLLHDPVSKPWGCKKSPALPDDKAAQAC
jgi:hypothetical protein